MLKRASERFLQGLPENEAKLNSICIQCVRAERNKVNLSAQHPIWSFEIVVCERKFFPSYSNSVHGKSELPELTLMEFFMHKYEVRILNWSTWWTCSELASAAAILVTWIWIFKYKFSQIQWIMLLVEWKIAWFFFSQNWCLHLFLTSSACETARIPAEKGLKHILGITDIQCK